MPYLAGYPTPQDYGALANGVNNDAPAINALFAALSPGGVAFFPPGKYGISSTITASVAGTKVLGIKASAAYSAGGSNQTTIDALSGFTGAAMMTVSAVPDFEMENITLHGNNTTGTTTGLTLTGVNTQAKLRSVLVASPAGDGILYNPTGNNWVEFYDVGVYHAGVTSSLGSGFNLQGGIADSWFDNCMAAGCYTAGWNIQGGDNCTWTACRAEDSPHGYGFYVNNHSGYFGGVVFNGCSTDLNYSDGFRIDTVSGNGVIQINGGSFRRDGNVAGAGSSTLAGIAINAATMPVVLDGVTVTARQGDSGGADAPHWGVNVATSTYVSINGGYLSSDSTGAATHWDSAGRFNLGPNVLTATVSASVPTLNYNDPWSTSDNSRFTQSSTIDSLMFAQTNTVGSSSNPMVRQTHGIAAGRAMASQVSGDTSDRYLRTVDGTMTWGPGNASRDVTLSRTAAGILSVTSKGGAAGVVQVTPAAQTATTTVSNTTTETVLQTYTVPANDPQAGSVYHMTGFGVYSATASPTLDFIVRWGGTGGTLIASISTAFTALNLTNIPFWYDAIVTFRSTTSCTAAFNLEVAQTATGGADNAVSYIGTPAAATTVTTTGSSALVVDVVWGTASASNTISILGGCVRRLA